MKRDIQFVDNGPLAKALGLDMDRMTEIESEVNSMMKEHKSMQAIIEHFNEKDLTDAEWTCFIFAIGYIQGYYGMDAAI